ncbi:beta-galactosidase [Aliiroseovarius sp. KMU-50]|uniref:Beta-galactosidase n=1 Tax=Aliiroseovarius salicola TaxID=3009082 RepID=A0ABT4W2K7_9RHOB|nr:beta-galactosidase [Aliiroseovarius sp. KMU-50]MDA5094752.1 beta-galactosidase [Aliiroseovarius sp. KMU-50]
MKRTLGTCYYPEHWPEEIWADDARRMAEAGLTWVRIGEFSWSRLEPTSGDLRWEWLDRAIDTLGAVGLRVVLGTPTATPPRWMIDKHPDMLAVDADGRPRKFGSRRHYCFSHLGYREESRRITRLMAERYGQNPHIGAWQTDNEYGCHDTTISYSDAARDGFRNWLAGRYGDINTLNEAWRNIFWSMEYRSFDEVDLPNLTVTEPNPPHVQDFRRYTSDMVVTFNKIQVDEIKAQSKAPVSHNYMGRVTDFDHFAVGADLEIATWDSYPLGFLEDRVGADADHQRAYARQGDPDFQAFHHDLYRAVGRGRWWVMEQQPGPVNWAPYNPSPLPGIVRLWTWEAFAHGAEAVCYFRWRQAPFAQEQMHAGLLRPDSKDAPAIHEAREVAAELADAPEVRPHQAPVALIFDYDSDWAWNTQPHGAGLSYFSLVFDHYRALRRAGLSVDIVPPSQTDFTNYRLIMAPGVMHLMEGLKQALSKAEGYVAYGPRTGARDAGFKIPVPLPPAICGLDVTISRVESLRPDMPVALQGDGAVTGYLEELVGQAPVLLETQTGAPVLVGDNSHSYCGAWLDADGLDRLVEQLCLRVGIERQVMPEGVRTRRTASEEFWFNHRAESVDTPVGPLPPAGVLRRVL